MSKTKKALIIALATAGLAAGAGAIAASGGSGHSVASAPDTYFRG